VLQALQSRGESYDRARETLKHVSVDASGKVELEDWVEVRSEFPSIPFHPHFSSRYPHPTIHAIPIGQLNVKLRSQTSSITTKAGKVTVQGSNANVSHTINEDERREFTNHINGVSNNSVSRRARRPMTISTFVDSRRRCRCRFTHPDPHGHDAAVR